MDKPLRILRIISFCGLTYIFCYVFVFDIQFSHIVNLAIHPATFKDYFYTFILGSLIAYPIFFALSIIYFKVHYGAVSLFGSPDSYGILTNFFWNEVFFPAKVISNIHDSIFSFNSNWLGASFIGFNNSKGLVKAIRKIIGNIAYVTLPILFHIIFVAIVIFSYLFLLIFFMH